MPNWDNHIQGHLNSATRWSSVQDIRAGAAEKYKASVLARGSSRSTWPKPSVPFVQHHLKTMLRRRQVVAKIGAYMAAYFMRPDQFQIQLAQRMGTAPRPPRGWEQRRHIREFNDSVDRAWGTPESPLPDPWSRNAQQAVRPQAVHNQPPIPPARPPVTGPIAEEPLNIIPRLLPEAQPQGYSERLGEALRYLGIPQDTVPAVMQRFLTSEECRDILRSGIVALLPELRRRLDAEPKDLETEFFEKLARTQ